MCRGSVGLGSRKAETEGVSAGVAWEFVGTVAVDGWGELVLDDTTDIAGL
jgi:hypothetical protein